MYSLQNAIGCDFERQHHAPAESSLNWLIAFELVVSATGNRPWSHVGGGRCERAIARVPYY
jgi:hypothetical protein